MIKADEARQNIINQQVQLYRATEKQVTEYVEKEIGANIEFHSKNGIDCLEFHPYDSSRYQSVRVKEMARDIITKILKENGYEILANDIVGNILKVKW